MLSLLFVIAGKIVALTAGLMFFRYLSLPYRLMMLQVFLGMMAEVTGRYIVVRYHAHNIWLFNYYWLIELWVVGLAGILLLRNIALRRAFVGLLLIPTVLWIYCIYKNGNGIHPSPALTAIGTALVVIFITVLFHASFNMQKLATQPVFWLCLSVIVFFSGNVPFYSLFNYIYDTDPELLKKLFNITLVLNHIRYPIVAFSFYLLGRQQMATLNIRNHAGQ